MPDTLETTMQAMTTENEIEVQNDVKRQAKENIEIDGELFKDVR